MIPLPEYQHLHHYRVYNVWGLPATELLVNTLYSELCLNGFLSILDCSCLEEGNSRLALMSALALMHRARFVNKQVTGSCRQLEQLPVSLMGLGFFEIQ